MRGTIMKSLGVTTATRRTPGGMTVKRQGKVRKATTRGMIKDEPLSMYSKSAKSTGMKRR